jgi:hypothetical protein
MDRLHANSMLTPYKPHGNLFIQVEILFPPLKKEGESLILNVYVEKLRKLFRGLYINMDNAA